MVVLVLVLELLGQWFNLLESTAAPIRQGAPETRFVRLLKSSGPMGSVQSSRWDEAIYLMIPGTSCLATIVLSLRDKTIQQTVLFRKSDNFSFFQVILQ
jgi:hypothetical protein